MIKCNYCPNTGRNSCFANEFTILQAEFHACYSPYFSLHIYPVCYFLEKFQCEINVFGQYLMASNSSCVSSSRLFPFGTIFLINSYHLNIRFLIMNAEIAVIYHYSLESFPVSMTKMTSKPSVQPSADICNWFLCVCTPKKFQP